MNAKLRTGLVLFAPFLGIAPCPALAEGPDAIAPTTEKAESEVILGYLKDENVSFKPQVGGVAYTESTGDHTVRIAEGLGIEWNMTPILRVKPSWYVGISTGAMVSNLSGSDLAFVPLNLKEGYNFTDFYRISVHGGGNLIYRSVTGAINLSSSGDLGRTDSTWIVYPNLGMDLDVAIAKNVALFLRPDFTLAPSGSVFLGTLGLGINLG